MPYHAETGRSHPPPPNRLTLRITLMPFIFFQHFNNVFKIKY